MNLRVNLGIRSYSVVIQRGALACAKDWFDLDRKVLIVTDSGVPKIYAETVAKQCKYPVIVTFPAGEESKNVHTWMSLLDALTEHEFTRTDCVVAVGGGVVGDMSGFAAASYLRGIDFYNIPTTLLAQIDSSVGGKVGIDYKGYKNTVGAFYQPKGVLVDPDVLQTLDDRQVAAGMAEAVKIAMIRDKELFELLERGEGYEKIEEVIYRSLQAKANVVEEDEREGGLRQILNFGHTLGHGIETAAGYTLLHGECVALGMIPMTDVSLRDRLTEVLRSLHLPTKYEGDLSGILSVMAHDKKRAGEMITVVRCPALGECILQPMKWNEFEQEIKEALCL